MIWLSIPHGVACAVGLVILCVGLLAYVIKTPTDTQWEQTWREAMYGDRPSNSSTTDTNSDRSPHV